MQKKKIFIVDDEKSFPNMVKLYLEKSGDFEVTCEYDSQAALAKARELKPDAMFLDIVMPNLNGPELKLQMDQDPFLADVPKVFLTSLVKPDDTVTGDLVVTGDGPALPKTVDPPKVIQCVEDMLAGRV